MDAESLPGSGPEGRVIERDVEAFISWPSPLSALLGPRALSEDLESPAVDPVLREWFVPRT